MLLLQLANFSPLQQCLPAGEGPRGWGKFLTTQWSASCTLHLRAFSDVFGDEKSKFARYNDSIHLPETMRTLVEIPAEQESAQLFSIEKRVHVNGITAKLQTSG